MPYQKDLSRGALWAAAAFGYHAAMTFPASLALFCRVVDNYGDIGICWRLARQLQREHAIAVTLWVDDLASFRRLCPAVSARAASQLIEGVTVRHWRDQDGQFSVDEVADIVIEFFACDILPGYIEAMARRTPRPVWLNLEGLSAEEWVEGCHQLPSMHPRLPLTKHFFFPGFTGATGGLLCEAGLDAERRAFQSDPHAIAAFLARLGVDVDPAVNAEPGAAPACRVSLFCYPDAPVGALLAQWTAGPGRVTCLVPEGVATEAIGRFLGAPAVVGARHTGGALSVQVLPFVAQPDYDRLLWSCDMNFVRGEDSFVRAQWAARPFVWHIYQQEENLHHTKLRAFLQRYGGTPSLAAFALAWNGASADDPGACWPALSADLSALTGHAGLWREQMARHGDLAANLLQFANKLHRTRLETTV